MTSFIPEEKITEIKNAADIFEIISEVVVLKKTGKNYVGLCPLHSEKTPSFTVSPDKQIFHCFGCGVGGNVISFIQKHNGLSFPESVKMLATRYGIEIPTQKMTPVQQRQMRQREQLLLVNKEAALFFHDCLGDGTRNQKATKYLEKRGISQETVHRFHLGYAPESWDSLLQFFSRKKLPLELVEKSGLVVSRKNSPGFYDRFRDRIIFPIFDGSLQVIGFGGRVLDDALPKYLNSPETPLYNKRRSLYGLPMAKTMSREMESVYIVEGYFDLLALHQHGIQNCVATLGTALTLDQVQIIKGFIGSNGRIILVYDSDESGIKAALRCIETFNKGYVQAQILVLPAGYDPDSYIFKFGKESFLEAASQARGLFPFLIDSALLKHGLSTDGKLRAISDLKNPLARIADPVERSLYIKELAERIDIDENAILQKIRAAALQTGRSGQKSTGKAGSASRHEIPPGSGQVFSKNNKRIEAQIIAMMLQFPEILPEIRERHLIDHFEDDVLKNIGNVILTLPAPLKGQEQENHLWVSRIIDRIQDEEGKKTATSMSINEGFWIREGCLRLISQFEATTRRGKIDLIQEIKAAEEKKDYKLLEKLLHQTQAQARKRQ
ncbi:MAG: DNA primase [Desulfobacterales bacterium]|nr:DNA primase [Desulfobacterales bacterium]